MARLAVVLVLTTLVLGIAMDEETLTFRVHEFPLSRMHNSIFIGNHMKRPGVQENHPDAGFLCKEFLFPEKPVLITGFEPIVGMSPSNEDLGPDYHELIHHMNIFLCSSDVQDEIVPAEDEHRRHFCSTNRSLGISYDRGAQRFQFPKGIGVRVGPGTNISIGLLQIHYLLPEKHVGSNEIFWDSSGFNLDIAYLSETAVQGRDFQSATIIGLLEFQFKIPPHEPAYDLPLKFSSEVIQDGLKGNIERYGFLVPFAIHLHGHQMLRRIWLEHWRSGEFLSLYAEIPTFTGYDQSQSFFALPNFKPEWSEIDFSNRNSAVDYLNSDKDLWTHALQPGDSFVVHCIYDTSTVDFPIPYGVSHNTEMCAPAIMFFPHNPDSPDVAFLDVYSYTFRHSRRQRTVNSKRKVKGLKEMV